MAPGKSAEGAVQSFRRIVGGREYLETVVWITRGDPPVVRFLFQTVAHGHVYALVFECDASDMPAYRERIIESILGGFEIAAGANEQGNRPSGRMSTAGVRHFKPYLSSLR